MTLWSYPGLGGPRGSPLHASCVGSDPHSPWRRGLRRFHPDCQPQPWRPPRGLWHQVGNHLSCRQPAHAAPPPSMAMLSSSQQHQEMILVYTFFIVVVPVARVTLLQGFLMMSTALSWRTSPSVPSMLLCGSLISLHPVCKARRGICCAHISKTLKLGPCTHQNDIHVHVQVQL